MPQPDLDARNADFWNELCGSGMAQTLGISDRSVESLRRFDEAYLSYYPYLPAYVTREALAGKRVLEIGLGYGTLGQLLAAAGCEYEGLDISPGPVAMMRYRLDTMGVSKSVERIQQGSALQIPHPDGKFDFVYSIGCLHHTGDTQAAVKEVHRVLAPGGRAVIMLYNKHSFRQVVELPWKKTRNLWRKRYRDGAELVRASYDANLEGDAAPHVDFISRREVRKKTFRQFAKVKIEAQNFDAYGFRGRIVLRREALLKNIARIAGTDLYITATK